MATYRRIRPPMARRIEVIPCPTPVSFMPAPYQRPALHDMGADVAISILGLAMNLILWVFSILPVKKIMIVSVRFHIPRPTFSSFVSASPLQRHSKTCVRNGFRKSIITVPVFPASSSAPRPIFVMILPFEISCPSSVCSRSRRAMVSVWPRN